MRLKLEQYRAFLAECWRKIGDDKILFVALVAVSVASALTEGFGIALFVPLLDTVSQQSGFGSVPVLSWMSQIFANVPPASRIELVAAIMFVIVVARGLLQYAVQFLNAYLPVRIERRLRLVAFDCLINMNLLEANARKLGELNNFVSGFPPRIGQVMSHLGSLVSSATMLVIYAGLMMLISVKLTIVSLVFMGGVFYLQRYISSGELRRSGGETTSAAEALAQVVYEMLSGLSLIRLSVAGGIMSARNRSGADMLLAAQKRYAYVSSLITPLFMTASGVLICLLLFAASAFGPGGAQAVTTVLLFLLLLQRLLGPAAMLTTARNAILFHIGCMADFDRWVVSARSSLQRDGDIPYTGLQTAIRFEKLTFAYDSASEPAVKKVTFTIPRGKMVAVVGPSGAGKSTVVSLLGRLYDPQSGAILVDGRDLRDFKTDTWRRRLSLVSQHIVLLNDSVERNLTFGLTRPVDDAELRHAADFAACSEFIDNLPERYQTLLGERGARLSGGQQQRLAIARAILADPEVLILDEATSHLDSITETAIQRALETFRDGRTLLIIAHRLSTIQRADKIIVLDCGELVEEGTHEALMQTRGRYWDMVKHQKLEIVDTLAEQHAAS